MTNQQIISLQEGLVAIQNQRLPINITYALLRDKKIIEPLVQDIETCRLDIIKRLANIEDDKYKVPAENMEQFTKEMTELYSADNGDINLCKIKLPDSFNISIDALEKLEPIISEEE